VGKIQRRVRTAFSSFGRCRHVPWVYGMKFISFNVSPAFFQTGVNSSAEDRARPDTVASAASYPHGTGFLTPEDE